MTPSRVINSVRPNYSRTTSAISKPSTLPFHSDGILEAQQWHHQDTEERHRVLLAAQETLQVTGLPLPPAQAVTPSAYTSAAPPDLPRSRRLEDTVMTTSSTNSLAITIRFGGQPLPDMPLTITPSTTIGALKFDVRAGLPASFAEHSIKLIYNGRQLRNQLSVRQELNIKTVEPDSRVYYVHCALPLAKDQSFESAAAKATFGDPTGLRTSENEQIPKTEATGVDLAAQYEQYISTATSASTSGSAAAGTTADIPPSIALRGLDRLRTIPSFTSTEIAALRAQFRGNIAARHTPDTMPSEEQLLQMEERWLDGSAFSSSLASAGVGTAATGTSSLTAGEAAAALGPSGSVIDANSVGLGTAGTLGAGLAADAALGFEAGQQLAPAPGPDLEAEDDAARALDDTLLGVLAGFFWPIGAVVWGLREEGVWSRRRGWSVLAGVLVNVGFGVVRVMG